MRKSPRQGAVQIKYVCMYVCITMVANCLKFLQESSLFIGGGNESLNWQPGAFKYGGLLVVHLFPDLAVWVWPLAEDIVMCS